MIFLRDHIPSSQSDIVIDLFSCRSLEQLGPVRLTIGLRVIIWSEADIDSELLTDEYVHLWCELGSPLWDFGFWKTVSPEDVVKECLGCFHGFGETFKKRQFAGLRKMVDDNEEI